MINTYNGLSIADAKKMQEELRKQLQFEIVDDTQFHTIAGADISFHPSSTEFYAAIVLFDYPSLKLKSYVLAKGESNFPYIAGYLGFREVPTLLQAWELLAIKPDVIMLDGQGILHPRRMGIASHFGVLTKCATLGCAKKLLYGFYEEPNILK